MLQGPPPGACAAASHSPKPLAPCTPVRAAAGFVAPAICRKVGPRVGMFIGGLAYVIYVASLIYKLDPVVYICSVSAVC